MQGVEVCTSCSSPEVTVDVGEVSPELGKTTPAKLGKGPRMLKITWGSFGEALGLHKGALEASLEARSGGK